MTMEIYEMLTFAAILIGSSWNAYRIGKKDASQEAMIGTLIFARDKQLLKHRDDIVYQYLNDDVATIVKMVVERKI